MRIPRDMNESSQRTPAKDQPVSLELASHVVLLPLHVGYMFTLLGHEDRMYLDISAEFGCKIVHDF